MSPKDVIPKSGREDSDIAIVGMSGLFPKADDIDVFWSNILNKVDAVGDAPEDWLGNGTMYDPDSQVIQRIYTKKGGFLGDLSRFDARKYGTMPLSLIGAQPDQFLALKLAHDALIDAGLTPGQFDSTRTGVILGLAVHANRANTNGIQQFWFTPQMREVFQTLFPELEGARIEEALDLLVDQLPTILPDAIPGLIPNILTGRIANRLDLMGPNYIIDAACASSLITIDLAMNELKAGNADIMLAGGVNTTTSPLVYAVFCSVDALSRTGTLRSFGRGANGTVLGEGAGIVVLKRLQDALDAEDRIYAVIKGAGQSSDGKSTGLMAPRREGAELAVRRAYENSGIDPATIGLMEAHGTGIALGEKTELDALRNVFGGRQGRVPTVPIGSVKSMIGHCIPASGSASVIKMALALRNRTIPPTLAGEVNTETGLPDTPFYVAEEPRPWIQSRDHPRRAAINAFGFGGINAHLILEESPVGRATDPTAAFVAASPAVREAEQVFVFAGADAAAVTAALEAALAAFAPGDDLAAAPEARFTDAPEARFTDAARASWDAARGQGPARLAIVAADAGEWAKKAEAAKKALAKPGAASVQTRTGIYFEAAPVEGKIAFLFPGEMGQYTDMLKGPAMAMPAIRDWIGDIAALTEDRRPVRLQDVIYPPDNLVSEADRAHLDGLMHQVDYGSEMVFAADQAICQILRSLGVKPDAMLGHSTGENAALVASGKLDLDRRGVCEMVADMNRVFDETAHEGAVEGGVLMTVAALSRDKLDAIRAGFDDIHFTMDNCPNQAILFGTKDRIDALEAAVVAEGAVCTRLPISWGYHTEYVRPMAEGFRALFDRVTFQPSDVTLWSCATAQPFPEDKAAALETAVTQYVSQVRFTEAIQNLYDAGHRIFVECGPSANLTAFVRDILGRQPHLAVEADNKRRGFLSQLRHVVARLYAAGLDVEAAGLLTPAEEPEAPARAAARAVQAKAPALVSDLAASRLTGEAAAKLRTALLPAGAGLAPEAQVAGAPEAQVAGLAPEAQVTAAPAIQTHLDRSGAYLAAQSEVMHSLLGAQPSIALPTAPADPRRIHVIDLARYFALPFPFRAYLMQGDPSYGAVAPYLAATEASEAAAMADPGRHAGRWQEWSLGRLAVKRAAAEMLAANTGAAPAVNELAILKDGNGAPYLAAAAAALPDISIAHVGGTSIGAAASPGWRMGVDYDLPGRIRDAGGFLDMILDPSEQTLDATRDADTAAAFWAAKEASAKALGVGLQGRPQAFRVTQLDPAAGTALVQHEGWQLLAHLRRVGPGICAVAYLAAAS